ncbi:MAG: MopE-related protein [Patescibacteria group bacterium]|jgi:cysteine-rich repeat protein
MTFILSFLERRWRYFIALIFMLAIIAGQAVASPSSDAIAIRVIPNPNHYSPLRGYKEQKFTSSPQSIVIDGYEAVRDGRTVYVNAANIANDNFYTNIYIISYNQDAAGDTVDIFGQILIHWKFNTNLAAANFCEANNATNCLTNSDCPKNDYCLSAKAKAIRDTKRLADLKDIKTALENYKQAKGYYPALSAGSYMANKTISVWPSWKTLSGEISFNMPLDPINKLGACGAEGYDPITCWDEKEKKFADPDPLNNELNLPDGSHAYIYTTNAAGASYNICANTESGLIAPADGSCLENISMNAVTCTDADNDSYNLEGGGCGPIDCDDAKNFIYPGANESCDTFDNNCNGNIIDEGCDDDRDGYCDGSMRIYNNTSMCLNTNFISNGMYGDDCNDSNAGIHPGAGCAYTYCGDSIIQNIPENDDGIAEACDDGNAASGDGCDENCQIE